MFDRGLSRPQQGGRKGPIAGLGLGPEKKVGREAGLPDESTAGLTLIVAGPCPVPGDGCRGYAGRLHVAFGP